MSKRLFKKVVAGIALTAMLLETGFQDYSMMTNVYAAETSSGEGIEVDASMINQEENVAEEVSSEPAEIEVVQSEESTPSETVDNSININIEQNVDGWIDEADLVGNDIALVDDEEEEHEKLLEISDDGTEISGYGYTDIALEVDASQIPYGEYFGMKFYSSADAYCNGELIEQNYVGYLNRDTTTLLISNLDYQSFTLYLVGETLQSVDSDYEIKSHENGSIEVAVVGKDDPEEEKSLTTGSASVKGRGYDSVEISMDYISLLANEVSEDEESEDSENAGASKRANSLSYSLNIYSDADVTVNGESLVDGQVKLDDSVSTIVIENLDGEFFEAGIEVDENYFVSFNADYSVESVEDGLASISVEYEKDVDTKTVYTYEDDKVKVVAKLSVASSIPDDAYFHVEPVDAAPYVKKLNDASDDEEVVYTEDNTLAYDVSFFTDESMTEVLEPEEGTVRISISFKQNQLEEEIAASEPETIEINHFVDDNTIETIEAETSVDGEEIEFVTDSLSVICVTNVTKGGVLKVDFEPFTKFGQARDYGVVAHEYSQSGDTETNVMVDIYTGSKEVGTTLNYSNAGGNNYIGSFKDTSTLYFKLAPKTIKLGDAAYGSYTSKAVTITGSDDKKDITKYGTSVVNENINVSGILSNIASSFSGLFNIKDDYNQKPALTLDDNRNFSIDLTSANYEAGTYITNYTGDKIAEGNGDGSIVRLNPANQKLILNITPTGDEFYVGGQLRINGNNVTNMRGSTDDACDNLLNLVILNFGNYAGTINLSNFAGVIIAPKATINNNNGGGIAVCNKFVSGSEWHYHNHNLPSPTGVSFTIKGKKKVDGNWASSNQKFTFELYEGSVAEGKPLQVVQNNGANIEFAPISFTDDYRKAMADRAKANPAYTAPFFFTIVERNEIGSGYAENTQEYKVCVYLQTDDNLRNSIQSVRYEKGKSDYCWQDPSYDFSNYMVFENYTPHERDAYYSFDIKKVFDEQNGAEWPDGKEFKFTMIPYNGGRNTAGAVRDSSGMPGGQDKITVSLTKENPVGSFGRVDFKCSDSGWLPPVAGSSPANCIGYKIFMYKIYEETTPAVPGVTYDDTTRYIKIFVNMMRNAQGYTWLEIGEDGKDDPNTEHRYIRISLDDQPGHCEPKYGPVEFTNTYKPSGEVEIVKYTGSSANRRPLEGTTFVVKTSASTPVYVTGSNGIYTVDNSNSAGKTQNMVTDADGKISLSGLAWGNYVISEVSATEGFNNSGYSKAFTIGKGTNAALKYTDDVYNEPKNLRLKLVKVDKKNNKVPISGVTFEIKGVDGDGNVVKTLQYTTGSDGSFTTENLPWAPGYKYTYEEKSVPAGYKPITGTFDVFSVNASNEIIKADGTKYNLSSTTNTLEVKVENEKYEGSLLLHKVGDNGTTITNLKDVEFEVYSGTTQIKTSPSATTSATIDGTTYTGLTSYVYDPANGSVRTYKTDNNGLIYIENLPAGSYLVKETSTPTGYVKSNDVTVSVENAAVKKDITNTTINVRASFNKKDADSAASISGATFALYEKLEGATSYSLKGSYVSDGGTIAIDGVSIGDYYLVETAVPANSSYQINKVDGADVAYCFSIDRSYKDTTDKEVTLSAKKLATIGGEPGDAISDSKILNNNTILNTNHGRVKLTKVATHGTVKNPLGGVQFKLEKKTNGVFAVFNGGYSNSGIYTTSINAADFGTLVIEDLESGDYRLSEVAGDYTVYEKIGNDIVATNMSNYTVPESNEWTFTISGTVETNIDGYYINKDLGTVENDVTKVWLYLVKKDENGNIINLNQTGFNFKFDLHRSYVDQNGATVDEVVKEGLTTKVATISEGVVGHMIDPDDIGELDYNSAYTYYFVETAAGEGYNAGATVTVDNSTLKNCTTRATAYQAVATDSKKGNGKVTLIKYKEDGSTPLKGAEFDLYSSNEASFIAEWWNKLTGSTDLTFGKYNSSPLVTDENGEIVVEDLPWGYYYFVETKAPEGYALNTEKKAFRIGAGKDIVGNDTLSNSALDVTRSIINTFDNGTVVITKKDVTSETAIAQKNGSSVDYTATFKLYMKDATTGDYAVVKEDGADKIYTTDAKGELKVSTLAVGEYYFVEESAPEGYILDKTVKYSFTITEDNNEKNPATVTASKAVGGKQEDNTVFNERKNGSIKLFKYEVLSTTDGDVEQGIAGATFYLVKKNNGIGAKDEIVKTFTTTSNGKVTFTEVPWDTYYIIEAPATGYCMLDSNGAIVATSEFTLKNGSNDQKVDGYKVVDEFVLNEENYEPESGEITKDCGKIRNDKKFTSVKVKKKGDNRRNIDFSKLNGQYPVYALYATNGTQPLETVGIKNSEWHTFTSKLIWGNEYYLVEKQAPLGYAITSNNDKAGYREVNGEYRYYFTANQTTAFEYEFSDEKANGDIYVAKATKDANNNTVLICTAETDDQPKFHLYEDAEMKVPVFAEAKGNGVYEFTGKTTGNGVTSDFVAYCGKISIVGLPCDSNVSTVATDYYLYEYYVPEGYSNSGITAVNVKVYPKTSEAMSGRRNYLNGKTDAAIIADGNVTKVYNSKYNGGIEFIKKDADATADDQGLAGISFNLYGKEGNSWSTDILNTAVSSNSADALGHVSFTGLPVGEYRIQEVESDAYEPVTSQQYYYFTISRDDTANPVLKDAQGVAIDKDGVYSVIWNSHKKGSVELSKVDADDDNAPMAGAVFTVYNADGSTVGTMNYSSSTKKWSMTNLTWEGEGTEYYIVETTTPAGYLKYSELSEAQQAAFDAVVKSYGFEVEKPNIEAGETDAKLHFVLSAANVSAALEITVPNYEQKGSLEIEKVDRTTGTIATIDEAALGSLQFKLIDATTHDLVSTITYADNYDNSSKTFKLDNIPWGSYVLIETAAPAGYILENNAQEQYGIAGTLVSSSIVIGKNGDSINLNYYLTRNASTTHTGAYDVAASAVENNYSGQLLIQKKSPSGGYLNGVVFKLYDAENNLITTATTRDLTVNSKTVKSAVLFDKLPTGDYYVLEEISSVDGAFPDYQYDYASGGKRYKRFPEIVENQADTYYEVTSSNVTEDSVYVATNHSLEGKILIKKVDSSNADVLPGAEVTDETAKAAYRAKFALYSTEPVKNILIAKGQAILDGNASVGGVSLYKVDEKYTTLSEDENSALFENLPYGTYYVQETEAPVGFAIDDELKQIIVSSGTVDGTTNVVTYAFADDKDKTKVKLIKVDQAGNSLLGATFALYEDGVATAIDTATLSDKNEKEFDNLEFGKEYYFVETVVPNGYVGGAVDTANSTLDVEKREVSVTGADGKATTEIRYYFTLTPEQISDKTLKVTIKNDLQLGKFELQKARLDENDEIVNYELAGIKFTLTAEDLVNNYDTDETLRSYELETNAKGYASIDNIPCGKYKLAETFVPENCIYPIRTDEIEVEVVPAGSSVAINFVNTDQAYAKAKIYKVDSVDDKPIKGIVFNVERKSGESYVSYENKTIVTDASGYAETTALPVGEYRLSETPESAELTGHVADEDKYYYFRITSSDVTDSEDTYKYVNVYSDATYAQSSLVSDGSTFVGIENDRKEASITLRKLNANDDETGLAGATFEVYAIDDYDLANHTVKEGKTAVATLVSGENGSTNTEVLPWGTYVYKETVAPKGYNLDTNEYVVVLGNTATEEGYYATVPEENEFIYTGDVVDTPYIEISKRALGTTTVLSDAVLTVSGEGIADIVIRDGKKQFSVGENGDLKVGVEYTLSETTVPAGYMKAQDVTFTIDEYGAIVITSDTTDDQAEALDNNGVNTLVMYDAPTIKITKAITGVEYPPYLAGAKLQVLDANGDALTYTKDNTEYNYWISTTDAEELPYSLNIGSTYTLHEEEAPGGYYKAADIPFTVNSDGTVTVDSEAGLTSGTDYAIDANGTSLVMYDKPFNILLKKVRRNSDDANQEFISGATLAIKTSDEAEVTVYDEAKGVFSNEFVTGKKPIRLIPIASSTVPSNIEEIKAQYPNDDVRFVRGISANTDTTYYVYEKSLPRGYVQPGNNAKVGTFTVSEEGTTALIELTVFDDELRLIVNKKDGSDNTAAFVSGARLWLVDKSTNRAVKEWVSNGKPSMLISVNADTLSDAEKAAYADYQIIGNVGLEYGKTYIVTERFTDADKIYHDGVPAGYDVAEDVEVTLNVVYSKDNKANAAEVTLIDTPLSIKISKRDAAGKRIKNATIQLFKKNGTGNGATYTAVTPKVVTIDTADTIVKQADAGTTVDTTSTYVAKGKANESIDATELVLGNTYVLVELDIPEGYQSVAEYLAGRKDAPKNIVTINGTKYFAEEFTVSSNASASVPSYYVTNYKKDELSLTVKKEWTVPETVGKPVVKVELYKGVANAAGAVIYTKLDKQTKTLTNNQAVFTGLERYEGDKQITYAIREVMTDSQTGKAVDFVWSDKLTRITLADTSKVDALVITDAFTGNTVSAEVTIKNDSVAKTEIKGSKTWLIPTDDNGELLGNTANATARFYLLRDGEKVKVADNSGYIAYVGDKAVEQKNNTYYSVDVQNGQNIAVSFTNLDEFNASTKKAYKYSLTEVLVYGDTEYEATEVSNGYEFNLTGDDGRYFKYLATSTVGNNGVINYVNKPVYDPFEISGIKKWVDGYTESASSRPRVEIVLYRDGVEYMSKEIKAEDNYAFAFKGLYEYDFDALKNGGEWHKYTYSLGERQIGASVVNLDQYELTEVDITMGGKTYDVGTLTGFAFNLGFGKDVISSNVDVTLTNEEFVEISGTKTWDDRKARTERPVVTVELLRDGTKINETYIYNYQSSYTFNKDKDGNKLPKVRVESDGTVHTYNYTVNEVPLDGYVTYMNGNYDFVNRSTKVRLSKVDATNSAELPGAELELREGGVSGTVVEKWTSTSTPHYVEGLTAGATYTLVETKAPTGYTIADPVTVVVGTNGVEQTFTMRDERIFGAIRLTKLDTETREALSGAVFNLYTADGSIVSGVGSAGTYEYYGGSAVTSFAVGTDGVLNITGLPFGEYYFREVTAPEGYTLSGEARYVTVSSSTETVEVTFLNTKTRGRARLYKVSGADGSPLAGATFELYAKTPRTTGQAIGGTLYSDVYYLYGTYVTDGAGTITVPDLPWDDYYFIETEAPEGYVLNLDTDGSSIVYPFTVSASNASATIPIDLGPVPNPPAGGGGGGTAGTGGGGDGGAGGGVAGVRRLAGSGVSGVLGVRAKPTSGVLGVRVGPTTGDVANIALWLVLLLASVGVVVAICIQASKKGKSKSKKVID